MRHISRPPPLVVGADPPAAAQRTARFAADEKAGSEVTR
jgi:hypothetical protein